MHALTDVTGFGLLGHLLEMCRGAGARRRTSSSTRMPLHPGVLDLAGDGFVTGASRRNFDAYGERRRRSAPDIGERERALLTDPQTSGGLLVACAPDAVDAVLAIFRTRGLRRGGADRALRRRRAADQRRMSGRR